MKHRKSKIKLEHHMIKDLRRLLEEIQAWDEIKTIIPGRISKSGRNGNQLCLTVQYETSSGLKCLAYSKGTVQEVYIVTSHPAALRKKLERL